MSLLILFAGIGFLLCVLWIDLVFDALVLPYRNSREPLPEDVLATMAHFFQRLTLEPRPLFVVMLAMFVIIILQIVQASISAWVGWASIILFIIPTGFAAIRIIPAAQQLGSRKDSIEKQSELARSLFTMHLFCFVLIILLGAIQLYAASTS